MKPPVEFGKLRQLHDGEIHRYPLRKDGTAVVYTLCCDCALVHIEEFKPAKTYIRVRVWRDDQKTKQFRSRKRRRRAKHA